MSFGNGHLQSPSKRRRLSPPIEDARDAIRPSRSLLPYHLDKLPDQIAESTQPLKAETTRNITLSASSKLAGQTVAPYMTKHIPGQYARTGGAESPNSLKMKDSNSKYCYRHRPDLMCRGQANEPSMEQLQHASGNQALLLPRS